MGDQARMLLFSNFTFELPFISASNTNQNHDQILKKVQQIASKGFLE